MSGNPYWRGRLSTFDHLILTGLDQLLLILHTLFTFLQKQATLNEEVNLTEPPPQLELPTLVLALALADCLASLEGGGEFVSNSFKHCLHWRFICETSRDTNCVLCNVLTLASLGNVTHIKFNLITQSSKRKYITVANLGIFTDEPLHVKSGSAITNGREPRSCLGPVFNFKLSSFTR
jgi:hypothetical protein